MKIGVLIERLQEFDPDREVLVTGPGFLPEAHVDDAEYAEPEIVERPYWARTIVVLEGFDTS